MKTLAFVVFMMGCQGSIDQVKAGAFGYTLKCIDGVAYLVFPQSVTVKYEIGGKPVACK